MKEKEKTILDQSVVDYIERIHSQNNAMAEMTSDLCRALIDEKMDSIEREKEKMESNKNLALKIYEELSTLGVIDYFIKKSWPFKDKRGDSRTSDSGEGRSDDAPDVDEESK